MTKTINKLSEINQLKSTNIISIGLILYINIFIISIFAQYYTNKLNLNNPLIPKELVTVMFEPYAKKGFILAGGLPIILVLKFLKQNLLVIIGAIILIAICYSINHSIDWQNK